MGLAGQERGMGSQVEDKGRSGSIVVRHGGAGDFAVVSRIAGDVFSPYGDYSDVLPSFLFADEVVTLVAETEGRVVGFLQFGFVPFGAFGLAADVIAIGVLSSHQGRGIGRLLFQRAFDEMERSTKRSRIRAVMLTVAHTNDRAVSLFESLGFRFTGEVAGEYDGGQKALRMMRPCCRQRPVGKERGERTR